MTPTGELVLEVLAARRRLGESGWTFDAQHRQALRRLEADGYIGFKSGIVENTFLVWLVPNGPAEPWCRDTIDYRPIVEEDERSLARLRSAAYEYVPEDTKRHATACYLIESNGALPSGWTLTAMNAWLTAHDEHGDVTVQIRPSDVHGGWYGAWRHPGDHTSDQHPVDGSTAVETFRRAVAYWEHAARQ